MYVLPSYGGGEAYTKAFKRAMDSDMIEEIRVLKRRVGNLGVFF